MSEARPAVPPGLRGVPVTETALGDVRGIEGFYHYRQYSAVDLAGRRSLEDVWCLLVDGQLPVRRAESVRFAAEVAAARVVPDEMADLLADLATLSNRAGPLDGLRSAMSALGCALDLRPLWDLSPAERRRDLLRLAAATPVLAAGLHRMARGQEPIPPDPSLPHAADYLRMLTGTTPDPQLARALEQYLILTVDHGFNSSTFAARVVASTGADAAAAVTAALGALSGPLHGGAPSRALDTLDAIGRPERAEAYVRGLLDRGERVMGFGHAVYRTDDPRSVFLRDVAATIAAPLADLAVSVERTVLDLLAQRVPGRPLRTNVEYYAGVVMDGCGLPRSSFTPTFAVSRVIGWSANIAEQAAERQLIRPAATYVGPPPPAPVPELEG
jgi:citrate synthase